LRIDAGYRAGNTVSPYYDAMLAKVIAWAPTREGAIERLDQGLSETDIRDIVTNLHFLSALVTHKAVRANRIDTGFIERELAALTKGPLEIGDFELAAAVAAILGSETKAASPEPHSPWQTFGWMPVGQRQRKFVFRSRQVAEHPVTLSYGSGPTTLATGKHTADFS
jgi:3-methylcrotonyl-CoA carboxylase alpha subunit